MKYILSLVFFLLLGSFVFGQQISYYGEVSDYDSGGKLSGVTVKVLQGGREVTSVSTQGGKYTVKFDAGKTYKIEYIKSGYVTKFINVDVTKIDPEELPPGGKIFAPINLDLFTERSGADFSFLKSEPVASWYFNNDRMDFDSKQAAQVKKRVKDALDLAANSGGGGADYNSIIGEADKLFDAKKYDEALSKYESAVKLPGKATEKHPNTRIVEIGDILQKQAQDDLDKKQGGGSYEDLLAEAEKLVAKKQYDDAIDKLYEAANLRPGEKFPENRIEQILDLQEAEKKRTEYDDLIKRGDSFLKQNSLEAARDKFKDAAKLLPKEEYPKKKLEEINKKLDAQSEVREKKEKYNQAIEEADKLYNSEDYEAAIEKYKEAITYESAASYPGDRIKMAEERLEEQRKEQEKLEQFNQLVEEGDGKTEEKEYEEAVGKYTAALELFPADEEAQKKLKKAEELLAEKIQNAEKWEQFEQLVAEGDSKVEGEEYETAIEKYSAALEIFEEKDKKVEEKLESAQSLLKIQQENAEKLEEFKQIVADADQKVEEKDYAAAVEKYDEALALIAESEEVKSKKENAQKMLNDALAESEKQERFDNLVKEGDEKADANEYTVAIEKYNSALEVMEDEEVKSKIEILQARIKEQEANQEKSEKINKLFASAEEKMGTKDYSEAIKDYDEIIELIGSEAIGITGVNDDYQKAKDGKEQAQNLLTEQQSLAELEGQITELLAAAQEKMSKEEYSGAIEDFSAVLSLDSDNEKAIEGKTEAERKILELKSAEEKEELNQQIQELINQAEELKPENKWTEVIGKYEEALVLDASRTDVEDLLSAAQKSKEEWEAEQSKEELFSQFVQEGNEFMSSEQWEDAKGKYESALEIKEDAEVTEQLELAKKKIAEALELLGQEEQFQALIKQGEEHFDSKNYEKALSTFQQALEIKEDDIAKEKIKETELKIAEFAEQEERYRNAMEEGNRALGEKDFASAIKFFDDALLEKPADEDATQQKEEAKKQLNSLKAVEEQFEELMTSANEQLSKAKENDNNLDELLAAKEKFKEAQEIKPNASEPQNKIVEIDELLREQEEALAEKQKAELEAAYQEQLNLASAAADEQKYTEAIAFLEEAISLKPEESFPKEKKAEYQGKLGELAAAEELENIFNDYISQADKAFNSENYEESISLYEEALKIKSEEEYPKTQIELAKENKAKQEAEEAEKNYKNIVAEADGFFKDKKYESALEKYETAFSVRNDDDYVSEKIAETKEILRELKEIAEREEAERNYQNTVKKADDYFDNEQYKRALETYETAFAVKSDDTYVKDRIDETKQVLKNLAEIAAKQAVLDKQFASIVKEADALFEQEDFIEAKKKYETAQSLKSDDAYVGSQIEMSTMRQIDKEKREAEERYQGILSLADQLLKDEDYEEALEKYETAAAEREEDAYPKRKIKEIQDILFELARMNSNIEYLGKKSNISIIEGAALLEQGARQLEQLKRKTVEEQIYKNEDKIIDLSISDYQQRVDLRTEIVDIMDKRSQLIVDEVEQHWDFLNYVEAYEGQLAQIRTQFNKYLEGKVGHNYRKVEYIDSEMDEVKRNMTDDHQYILREVNAIEKKRADMIRAELAHHKVSVVSTAEELLKIEKQNEELPSFNTDKLIVIHEQIKSVEDGQEVKELDNRSLVYDRLLRLEDDATTAEKQLAAKSAHQIETYREIQGDVYETDKMIQNKREAEVNQARKTQLEIDEISTQLEKHYAKTQEGKDDKRINVVNLVDEMSTENAELYSQATKRNYQEKQDITQEVVSLEDLKNQQAAGQKKDLSAINENLKEQVDAYDKAEVLRNKEDKVQRQETLANLDMLTKNAEKTTEGKSEKPRDNYESVKDLETSTELDEELESELKERKLRTQEMIDKLENNKLTFSPAIANTIGESYPEGVTQEVYVREDKNGIPVRVITRRFVVQDGHGDIYIRFQTRSGLTYSKNGNPISEQGWINGTENAKLEKHFN